MNGDDLATIAEAIGRHAVRLFLERGLSRTAMRFPSESQVVCDRDHYLKSYQQLFHGGLAQIIWRDSYMTGWIAELKSA